MKREDALALLHLLVGNISESQYGIISPEPNVICTECGYNQVPMSKWPSVDNDHYCPSCNNPLPKGRRNPMSSDNPFAKKILERSDADRGVILEFESDKLEILYNGGEGYEAVFRGEILIHKAKRCKLSKNRRNHD